MNVPLQGRILVSSKQSHLTFILVENHREKAIHTQSLRASIKLYHLHRRLHMFPRHDHIAERNLNTGKFAVSA